MNHPNRRGTSLNDDRYWGAIDWSLPTAVICEMTGKRATRISAARKRYAPETTGTIHKAATVAEAKWAGVDWGKKDRQIAEETGASKGVVWAARRRYAS